MTAHVAALRRAAADDPGNAERWHELGVACFEGGLFDEAERCCRRVLEIDRNHAKAHFNLGAVLHRRGALEEAERCYRSAIVAEPDLAPAQFSLGLLLFLRGGRDEGLEQMRRALALEPGRAQWHAVLGSAYNEADRPLDARASLKTALQLDPASGFSHEQLAGCLLNMGDARSAVELFRRAWELDPSLQSAGSNLIFTLDLLEGGGADEQQAERRRWNERHARMYAEAIPAHRNLPDPERRLRIGYVSADFRRHSASYLFAPVIARHDRAQFEVFCYSGVSREDEVTAWFRGTADAWHSVETVSDEALAGQIRNDGIDILVDLSGHSAGNRLLVFARKPAPVQVTAWGHATGTGLEAMDYFLADPVLVPPEERSHYAEEVVDLPCCLCYQPPEYLPEVSTLPALSGKPFTFGCINRIEKISDRVIALWGRILAQMPRARLMLKHRGLGDTAVREPLLDRLTRGGVKPAQLRLAEFSHHAEHLKVFQDVDLGLDPFPHGGGVSSLEALWMGVPVLTLRGTTATSRLSASILNALGMPEWIAGCDEAYVRIALAAARDLPPLEQVRQGLRTRCAQSVIGDTQRYTRGVEAVYRAMWQRWCAGRHL